MFHSIHEYISQIDVSPLFSIDWQQAHVVHISKKVVKYKPSNYRPAYPVGYCKLLVRNIETT